MADVRYSDSDLAEFKAVIDAKIAAAQNDLDGLRGSLSHADDNGTDDTSHSFKMMEEGAATLSREEVAQLAGRQEKFLKHLENALISFSRVTLSIVV